MADDWDPFADPAADDCLLLQQARDEALARDAAEEERRAKLAMQEKVRKNAEQERKLEQVPIDSKKELAQLEKQIRSVPFGSASTAADEGIVTLAVQRRWVTRQSWEETVQDFGGDARAARDYLLQDWIAWRSNDRSAGVVIESSSRGVAVDPKLVAKSTEVDAAVRAAEAAATEAHRIMQSRIAIGASSSSSATPARAPSTVSYSFGQFGASRGTSASSSIGANASNSATQVKTKDVAPSAAFSANAARPSSFAAFAASKGNGQVRAPPQRAASRGDGKGRSPTKKNELPKDLRAFAKAAGAAARAKGAGRSKVDGDDEDAPRGPRKIRGPSLGEYIANMDARVARMSQERAGGDAEVSDPLLFGNDNSNQLPNELTERLRPLQNSVQGQFVLRLIQERQREAESTQD